LPTAERLSIWHSHPRWMVERWLERWGEPRTIALLEANAAAMPSVTAQIVAGADARGLIERLAQGLELRDHERSYAPRFDCRCTRERVERALAGLGRDELRKIVREQPETEATCDFCKRRYVLSAAEVEGLLARLD